MSQVIHRTSAEFKGPWLLDIAALDALDAVVSEQKHQLEAYRTLRVEEKVEEVFQEWRGPSNSNATVDKATRNRAREYVLGRDSFKAVSHTLVIHCQSGKKLIVETFKEARVHPDVEAEMPVSFELSLRAADISCSLSLKRSTESLELDVVPETGEQSRSTFVAMRDWATTQQPSRWLRTWHEWNGIQWFVFGLCILIPVITQRDTSQTKADARALLNHGVTDQNLNKAVELMLAIQTDFKPDAQMSGLPKWVLVWTIVGVCASVVLSVAPKSSFSVGRGALAVQRWKLWSRFVLVTVPTFISVTFLKPYCVSTLKTMLQFGQ